MEDWPSTPLDKLPAPLTKGTTTPITTHAAPSSQPRAHSPVPAAVPASDERLSLEKEKKMARLPITAPVLNGHGKVVASEFSRPGGPKKPVAITAAPVIVDTSDGAEAEEDTAPVAKPPATVRKSTPAQVHSPVPRATPAPVSDPSSPVKKKALSLKPVTKPVIKRARSPASSPVRPVSKSKRKVAIPVEEDDAEESQPMDADAPEAEDEEDEEAEEADLDVPLATRHSAMTREPIHATQEMEQELPEVGEVEPEAEAEADEEAEEEAAPSPVQKPRSRLVKVSEQPTPVKRRKLNKRQSHNDAEDADKAALLRIALDADDDDEEDEEANEEEGEEGEPAADSPVRKTTARQVQKVKHLVDKEDVKRLKPADVDFIAPEKGRQSHSSKSKSRKSSEPAAHKKARNPYADDEAEEEDADAAAPEEDEMDEEDGSGDDGAEDEDGDEADQQKEEVAQELEARRANIHPMLIKCDKGKEMNVLAQGVPIDFRCGPCKSSRKYAESCTVCKGKASQIIERDQLDASVVRHILFFDGFEKCTFSTRAYLLDKTGKRLRCTKAISKELLHNTKEFTKQQQDKTIVNWAALSVTANRRLVKMGDMEIAAPIVDDSQFLATSTRKANFAHIIESFNESIALAILNGDSQWLPTEDQAQLLHADRAAAPPKGKGKPRGARGGAAAAPVTTTTTTTVIKATPGNWNVLVNRFNTAMKSAAHIFTAPNVDEQLLFENVDQVTALVELMATGPDGMLDATMEHSRRALGLVGAAIAILFHQNHPASLSRNFPPRALPLACTCKGPCNGACEKPTPKPPVYGKASATTTATGPTHPFAAHKPVTTTTTATTPRTNGIPAATPAPKPSSKVTKPVPPLPPIRSGKTERETDVTDEELAAEIAAAEWDAERAAGAAAAARARLKPVATPPTMFQRPAAPGPYFGATHKKPIPADAYGDDADQAMASMELPLPKTATGASFKRPLAKIPATPRK